MFGPVVEGRLVVLRPPKPEDAAAMTTWFEDVEVTRYLKLRFPPSLDAEKEFLDRTARDPDLVFWVIEHEGKVVGGTSIVRIDWQNGFGTTGTVIADKRVWGKGLGRELMRLRAEYAEDVDIMKLAREDIDDHVVPGDDLRDELIRRYAVYWTKQEARPPKKHCVYPV